MTDTQKQGIRRRMLPTFKSRENGGLPYFSSSASVTRRTTFRLYPNKQQSQKLHYWRQLHCLLYNAAVYHRKSEYQRFGKSVSYLDQQNCLPAFKECWGEYKELGSQALQATLKRVDFAYQRFFQGLGKRPRFKASRRYSGFTYPGIAGWKVESNGKHGHLALSNLGKIQMRGQVKTGVVKSSW